MLNGQYAMLSWSARDKVNDLLPIEHFRIPFKPLETLKNKSKEFNMVYAVLSVGGNDVREILGDMS